MQRLTCHHIAVNNKAVKSVRGHIVLGLMYVGYIFVNFLASTPIIECLIKERHISMRLDYVLRI